MKRVRTLILIVFAAGAGLSASMAAKGKALPTTATFWNGPGDGIWSDGNPYVDGSRGVVCQVRTDPSTNYEFILNIRKTTRRVWYMFPSTSLLSLGCGVDPNAPLSDGVAVDSFVNLHGIGAMQVGEIRAVRANAWAGTAGQFNFLDNYGTPSMFEHKCSTNIAVHRADQTHWYASTSIDRIDGITGAGFAAPILDATLNEVLPGDTAQLNDVTTRAFKGNYAMPFGMTIYCPSCTLAPPTCGGGPCEIPQ